MEISDSFALLFAEIDRFSEMGRQLRGSGGGSSSSSGIVLLGVLFGIAAIAGGSYALFKYWSSTPSYKRLHLFRRLCQTHGLSRNDRARLMRLAKLHQIENSADVFVRPELFDGPSSQDSDNARDWLALMKLRDRLFARRIEASIT